MTRRVVLLATLHITLAAVLSGLAWGAPIAAAGVERTLAFAAAFAIVGLLPVHIELGRHATSVTLVDAVLVVGLFAVHDARAVALAAMAGEIIACGIARQHPLKLIFNASSALGTVTIAALTFALLGSNDATKPSTWAITFAALFAYWLSNHASTSMVLTVVTGRRFHDLFVEALVPAAAATAVSAGIGITIVVLFVASPFAPVLLAPLAVVSYAAFRAVAAHRAESLRFKRLYEASSRTGSVRGIEPMLSNIAAEARELAAGVLAIVAAPDEHGRWTAVAVDDETTTVLDRNVVYALVDLAAEGTVEVSIHDIDPVIAGLAHGARHVIVASPVGGLNAVIAVFRDISDDRHDSRVDVITAFAGHAALATSNARLFDELEASLQAQIDLNRQKDNFLAAVSHELRTPLTSVIGSLGTLRQHAAVLKDEQREMLHEIAERQGWKLKRLIEDLLLVAATESGATAVNVEPIEVKPFLNRMAAELRPDADVVVKPTAPRVVVTDPSRVKQVLEAVLENAGKFAPGPVELIATVDDDDHLVISVRDHGPGIPEPDRERVFERFVQLDQSSTRVHGGTGTGLYLCRQLADLLGGELSALETPGGGATFSLVVPDLVTRPGEPDRAIASRSSNTHHDEEVPASAGT